MTSESIVLISAPDDLQIEDDSVDDRIGQCYAEESVTKSITIRTIR